MASLSLPVFDRIVLRLDMSGDCWLWKGAKNDMGYGVIGTGLAHPKVDRVHRIVYECVVGRIPDGKHVHHICREPACVHPDHLELLTPAEHRAVHREEKE